ncbi:MAG: ATP-dependent DNA helicase RecG [Candidatus Woesebacteria bacterium GW2011_GWB1_38_5b]|uniref:ATP-dependent DNA helicase RecG n=1 Tax=Candidatus Woesebacteria bacterium GW2011_GWB1_38_5b TaxID=1618569 RepID=A0A0G0MNG9_9BACT|nr:MAG: ATP-dependent DNA helicase RecG [Candidatus Woesebacteria bacterium GW2011_GWB1_38_5b]OGH47495.1 MAG: ATP-dependent DNA helicase RecG [Candidatus Levybacteria bacterium RIFCSPLOWO2_01_FULL_39_10]
MAYLSDKIGSQGGIYKRYSRFLEKLEIITFEDFLYHIPARYQDFSIVSKIASIQEGETVTVKGVVKSIKNEYTRRGFIIQKAKVEDETGIINVIWFNQPYIPKSIREGEEISLSGKAEKRENTLQLTSPDFEPIIDGVTIHTGRLVPVYPETRGVSSKWIRRQIYKLFKENKDEMMDFLPDTLRKKYNFDSLYASLFKIHFPNTLGEAEKAKQRLSFDELFLIQLSSDIRRKEWKEKLKGTGFKIDKNMPKINKFIEKLPFILTSAQKKAVEDILHDLSSNKPMNRLLQGDVGSGKTVVAGVAMYTAHLNGFQSVIMAPTEILANQHYKTISSLLKPFGLKIELRTSSSKNKTLDNGHLTFDILVGTHAVIHKGVSFKKLGLVIIDEQHRFGVEQRGIIRKKGGNPHVLTMTATPIPRTIALTLYGDLDLSTLYEMPKGRRVVKTWLVPNEKREKAYAWIKKHIDENKGQVFIICPFIEESESMATVKAAVGEYERLKKNVFNGYKIALLHGKLKSKEKEEILSNFKNKIMQILVATPVVEVGIDIPGADIIIIETAERFGLAQLHQLRGRVGRSERQSYCMLFTDSNSPYALKRLKALEQTNIGAELAELDLKLRGPGEIYGTEQSGRGYLKIASFSDLTLIEQTKKEAQNFANKLNKFPMLVQKVEEINVKNISPD